MKPHVLAAILFLSVLAGCTPNTETPAKTFTLAPAAVEPSVTQAPAETESVPQSQPEAENVFTFDEMGIVVGFDYPEGFAQGIGTSFNGTYVPNAPYDLPYPQNAQVVFTSYLGGSDFTTNGLRGFRADEVNALETGAVESLNAVLEGQTDHHNDFPRLAGAGSIIDAQLTPLAFQNGNGYRYLVAKSFSADPLQSTQLTYMYQGVTNDGKYFASFIMLVDAPFLAPYIGQPLTTPADFETYFQNVNDLVETSSGDQFAPSLTILDELIASIIITQR
ncbi:MAG: hypothetical protein HYU84_04025 [Chloroflexi bacterium]|nr:hypothetical protein [Chloroflexota bacterium]